MNYIPFARKHIRDLTDWQRKDGAFPQIAPYGGVDSYMNTMNGSVGWTDAGVLIPYRYWKLFGDVDFIRDNYDAMAKYAWFMMKRCGKFGLFAKPLGINGPAKKFAVNIGQSYGEWAEPEDVYPNHWTDMVAPHPEVSTAYTAYVMSVMEEIAETLDKTEDIPLYCKYKEGCTAAYQAMAQTEKYTLDTDRQARLVRPLYFGLLNKKQTEFAKKRLLQELEHYHWRVGTGFLSTPLILYVLSDIDLEAAYRLLRVGIPYHVRHTGRWGKSFCHCTPSRRKFYECKPWLRQCIWYRFLCMAKGERQTDLYGYCSCQYYRCAIPAGRDKTGVDGRKLYL